LLRLVEYLTQTVAAVARHRSWTLITVIHRDINFLFCRQSIG